MSNRSKKFSIKIKITKNNSFISLSHFNGTLLRYKSLKNKKTKDIKIQLIWGLTHVFKQLRKLKIKIQFLNLYLQNLKFNQLQYLFSFFRNWNIQIIFFKYELPIPHNGCRKVHKSRKRNKSRKKNKEYLGL